MEVILVHFDLLMPRASGGLNLILFHSIYDVDLLVPEEFILTMFSWTICHPVCYTKLAILTLCSPTTHTARVTNSSWTFQVLKLKALYSGKLFSPEHTGMVGYPTCFPSPTTPQLISFALCLCVVQNRASYVTQW